MQQRINLYLKIERPKQDLLSARRIMSACIVLFVLLLLTAGVIAYTAKNKAERVVVLEQQQQQLQDSVNQLRATRDRLSDPGPVQGKIDQAKKQIQMKRTVLARLEQMPMTVQAGFSQYMSGLSNQHLEGLWFTMLEVYQGGEHIALGGQVRSPALVPQYLSMLGQEPAYAGQQFNVFRLSQPEKQPWLHDFEVRSQQQRQPSEQ